MDALSDQQFGYRCYGRMDRRGRWRSWRFGPAPGSGSSEHAQQIAEAAAAGHVLFASVQRFAAPRNLVDPTWWREVRGQYTGTDALPHIAPLYFDLDCESDLDQALVWARELVTFFTEELRLPAGGRAGVVQWIKRRTPANRRHGPWHKTERYVDCRYEAGRLRSDSTSGGSRHA